MNLSSCAYQFFLGNISITVYREIFATVLFLAFLSSLSAGECLKFTKKNPTVFKCTRAKFTLDENNPADSIPSLSIVTCSHLVQMRNCVCSLSFVMPCYKQLYNSTISCKLVRLHIFSQEGEITKQPTRYLI